MAIVGICLRNCLQLGPVRVLHTNTSLARENLNVCFQFTG